MRKLSDQTMLITGATNGIGKSTALALAKQGANIVIVGRNAEKTAQVLEEIKTASGNPRIDYILADLSSQQEIHQLATTFKQRHERLDVLINNAGVMYQEKRMSVDGIEMTFAVNHLAYFQLSLLLIDTLKASAPARIVNVASFAHNAGKLDFENLQGEKSYSAFGNYGLSKLANILFTRELARRLEGTQVTVNALHPGTVKTGWTDNTQSIFFKLYKTFLEPIIAISPEKGAQTSIYLAASPEVADITGGYFNNKKLTSPNATAQNDALAKQLWDVSLKLVNLQEPVI